MKRSGGFSLLELLVVLALFAGASFALFQWIYPPLKNDITTRHIKQNVASLNEAAVQYFLTVQHGDNCLTQTHKEGNIINNLVYDHLIKTNPSTADITYAVRFHYTEQHGQYVDTINAHRHTTTYRPVSVYITVSGRTLPTTLFRFNTMKGAHSYTFVLPIDYGRTQWRSFNQKGDGLCATRPRDWQSGDGK